VDLNNYAEFRSCREEQQRLEESCWGFQGGMPLCSQRETREGEAESERENKLCWQADAIVPLYKKVRKWPIKSDWSEKIPQCFGVSITILKTLTISKGECQKDMFYGTICR
jgi:hypothetical protein